MVTAGKAKVLLVTGFVLSICLAGAGCQTTSPSFTPANSNIPRELEKMAQPAYTIEAPDILLLDAVRLVPKPPYRLQPLDSIIVQATGVVDMQPISGVYVIDPEGTVNLGFDYGSPQVADMTLKEAQEAIEAHLKKTFKSPTVRVSLAQLAAEQQIRGDHLVRPDGTVGLGTYGNVYVQGYTLEQAKQAIDEHLSKYLLKPDVSIDVYAYNSKVYYIVTDGAGYGEQVYRIPSTGNETVLDAMSQINGLPIVASKHRIWLARPAPANAGCYQVLPVDWQAIVRGGATATNYQVLPGDRIYVEAEPLITLDTYLARIFAPVERVFGVTLLGSGVVHSVSAPLGVTSGSGTGAGAGLGF
jgi:polysaccharide export outer membrane protein